MQSVRDFLAMGGYAAFVWPAYGIAALAVGGLAAQSLQRYRTALRALASLQGDRPTQRRARP